jgi:hypothetical protein
MACCKLIVVLVVIRLGQSLEPEAGREANAPSQQGESKKRRAFCRRELLSSFLRWPTNVRALGKSTAFM